MFLLLLFGAGVSVFVDHRLLTELTQITVDLRWPSFALRDLNWSDLLAGAVVLALPQVPLTLGNAVIAITEENNHLLKRRLIRL